MTDIVQKLWGFCHTLRHDGIDYGDYIEQITYLLFLKMADERSVALPPDCDWPTLRARSGTDLTEHFQDTLRALGRQSGLLGDIFAGAQSRFSNPVNLRRLVTLIDETDWTALDVDVKAEAFEGLLEKAASEGKKGAGQYFTPRLLIQSIVRCVQPDPRPATEFTIVDPACGTGGFLVAAYEWLKQQTGGGAFPRELASRIRRATYYGKELVPRPRRLALMNLYLHGLGPEIAPGDSIYEVPSGQRFDVVLTNPPFGTKGANQVPDRDDFTIATSNKQLNFLQHVMTILKPGGRAAVVVPDNVLFAEFERCFGPNPNGRAPRSHMDSAEDRWRTFTIAEVKARDFKIDSLKWLRDESLDDSDDLPEPEELATDTIAELEAAVEELNNVLTLLEHGNDAEAPTAAAAS